MNIVQCISGLKQEGKTTELVETCIDMMDLSCLNIEPRFYFITVGEDNVPVVKKIHDQLASRGHSEHRVSKIIGANIIKNISIPSRSKNMLYTELTNAVTKHDCEVFIDMPELLDPNFATNINEFIDEYPQKDAMNSIDIYWTRSRKDGR